MSLHLSPPRLDFVECPFCSVGRSSIHGEGLFALRNFKANDIVADYSASVPYWKRCPYTSISPSYHELSWFVGLSLEECALASPSSAFMRANHARNPNCLGFLQLMTSSRV